MHVRDASNMVHPCVQPGKETKYIIVSYNNSRQLKCKATANQCAGF